MNKTKEWGKYIIERIEREGDLLKGITAPDGMDLIKYGFVCIGKGKIEGSVRWRKREYHNSIARDRYHRKHPEAVFYHRKNKESI